LLLPACLSCFAAALLLSSCNRVSGPGTGGRTRGRRLSECTVYLARGDYARQVGFLVAEQHGMYRRAGVSTRIVFKDTYADVSAAVSADPASLGVLSSQDAIHFIATGAKFKVVDVVMHRCPLVIITRRTGDYGTLSDLAGKRLLVRKGTHVAPIVRAMMENARTSSFPVIVAVNDPVQAFAGRNGDAAMIDELTDLSFLSSRGLTVRTFYPDDYRVHPFGDVIVANRVLIAANPTVITGLLSTTRYAWVHSFNDPEGVLATLRTYHQRKIDWQREMSALEMLVTLILDDEGKVPVVRTDDWGPVISIFPASEVGGLAPRDVMVDGLVKRAGVEAKER
jgi:ABC-type nitrate/sulfonate/bicarbonate transport system substrate-binding protein